MNREQAFDPVDVPDWLADQPATLTIEPTVILFGDTRHAQNAPHFWLTTQIRHQRVRDGRSVVAVVPVARSQSGTANWNARCRLPRVGPPEPSPRVASMPPGTEGSKGHSTRAAISANTASAVGSSSMAASVLATLCEGVIVEHPAYRVH